MNDERYIAVSYNFEADYDFVAALSEELAGRSVPLWYLRELCPQTDVTTNQRLGGDFDWRKDPQNWHAAFVEKLYEAHGVLVVLSARASDSYRIAGRGMWRERAAIEFVRGDNELRVLEIDRREFEARASLLVAANQVEAWARAVLSLEAVPRQRIADPNAYNTPTGEKGPAQLPERKSSPTDWYELVRRDLYDVQWHCRRCSLTSYPYVMAHWDPPSSCPRCGFARYAEDSAAV